jgi:hypothetical protein
LPRRGEPVEKVGGRSIDGLKSGSEASKMVSLGLKRGSEAGTGEFFNTLGSSRKLRRLEVIEEGRDPSDLLPFFVTNVLGGTFAEPSFWIWIKNRCPIFK